MNKISYYVPCRSSEAEAQFKTLNATILADENVQFIVGCNSFFKLICDIIESCPTRYACIIHDDVFLPPEYPENISKLIHRATESYPNWALAGNAGISPVRIGYSANRTVRFLADPHGGVNCSGAIVPAETIDGNTFLIDCNRLRASSFSLPPLTGFQLYDICFSVEVLKAGHCVLIAPELCCYHGSAGAQADFDAAARHKGVCEFLRSRVRNRNFETLNGVLSLGVQHPASSGFDITSRAIEMANRGREVIRLASVIRTNGKRPGLLKRTVASLQAAKASLRDPNCLDIWIVCCNGDLGNEFEGVARILRMDFVGDIDTRFRAVHHAAKNIDADCFWFIDDDDWVFPNGVQTIIDVATAMPQSALIFVDTQHFREEFEQDRPESLQFSSVQPARRFWGRDFYLSVGGENYIPFCGMVFRRKQLKLVDQRLYETVTYFEDYSLLLSSLRFPETLPVSIDVLAAGISIRPEGNTVTELRRDRWNMSAAALWSSIAMSETGKAWFSVPNQLPREKTRSVDPPLAGRLLTSAYLIARQRQVRRAIDAAYAAYASGGVQELLRRIRRHVQAS